MAKQKKSGGGKEALKAKHEATRAKKKAEAEALAAKRREAKARRLARQKERRAERAKAADLRTRQIEAVSHTIRRDGLSILQSIKDKEMRMEALRLLLRGKESKCALRMARESVDIDALSERQLKQLVRSVVLAA